MQNKAVFTGNSLTKRNNNTENLMTEYL